MTVWRKHQCDLECGGFHPATQRACVGDPGLPPPSDTGRAGLVRLLKNGAPWRLGRSVFHCNRLPKIPLTD